MLPPTTQRRLQIAPDTSDPYDSSNFPSSHIRMRSRPSQQRVQTPRQRGDQLRQSFVDDLTNTVDAATVYADIQLIGSGSTFTGSDIIHRRGLHHRDTGDRAPPKPVLGSSSCKRTSCNSPSRGGGTAGRQLTAVEVSTKSLKTTGLPSSQTRHRSHFKDTTTFRCAFTAQGLRREIGRDVS